MTEKEIDLIASRNEEIPEFLALPEQLLFYFIGIYMLHTGAEILQMSSPSGKKEFCTWNI